ncbi:PAS domain-containing hybrid sensor histidine kinase/response regulator [Pseudidiomarina sediminum]|uniref:hybrid sensor histidine kinase/response regulator n=1 Tax=Pseudidiomarina sediminum TaxID=431675 RepID=UPI001C9851A5|nr:PAS domain-containing hybrid sensor histidine kinase/response regulator [Pseudidiomarina sediminum]MBY6064928.1 hybrid sensor histidine kinase/response regulator [Pseudidiomarina sediminum]
MLSTTLTVVLAILYIALLYSIAYRGERKAPNQIKPYRYALAQGIHCTTWAFYGTITQSAHYGWAMAPTYVGAIVVFLFAHRIQLRLLQVCKQQNLTSIADVISHRYGKSSSLSIVVALLALVGIVPYIALQLRAVTGSFAVASGITESPLPWFGDVAALVALAMIGFAVLFGTRRLSLAEQHAGLMDAVAFESVVKLGAFVLVGMFVSYSMFDGVGALVQEAAANPQVAEVFVDKPNGIFIYATHVLLGAISMFCLPRQFHVSYIENTDPEELRTARWAFPLYLFVINLFILPIALAGLLLVPDAAQQDTFMLQLLLLADVPAITAVAFIGGLASATSMVMIATLALSIMMSNDVIMPLWLKLTQRKLRKLTFTPNRILMIRRTTIATIILLAFGFLKLTEANLPLVNAGLLSLALLAQLAPALLGGLIWRRANFTGAVLGLGAGTLLWGWYLFLPSLTVTRELDDFALAQGVVLSLGCNLILYIVASWLRPSQRSKELAASWTDPDRYHQELYQHQPITWGRLRQVLARFFDSVELERLQQRSHLELTSAPNDDWVPTPVLARVERELAAVIGSAASRILLDAVTQQPGVPIAQVVTWATEASQLYKFNRELLQASVENIPQGISVVDQDLRLVAWNQRYEEIFHYPQGFLAAGRPVAELLRYNAKRGMLGSGQPHDLDSEISKRLNFLRSGSAYRYQRQQGDQYIELQGAPMPGGGFVTTYTDITDLVQAQQQLEEINRELESRVAERTQQLLEAKQAEERAHRSKSRFFAAVSHDLMQPFNAATLFCDMLRQRLHGEQGVLARQIQQSLQNAEELLTMLLDMTRLEAGNLPVNLQHVSLHEVVLPIIETQRVIAADKGLRIDYVPCSAEVYTDRKLLSRMLQNLLSNAVRYTSHGRILVGSRRRQQQLELHVIDTGQGIPPDQLQAIFREFHQVAPQGDNPGIGLGLAIVDRLSKLLQLPLRVESTVGRGTCFAMTLPVTRWRVRTTEPAQISQPLTDQFLTGRTLWLLDNDQGMLTAVSQLLSGWGATIVKASQRHDFPLGAATKRPDLIIVDYHLDDDDTGVEVLYWLRQQLNYAELPAIVISADPDEVVREQAIAARAGFTPKPLKPAALRRLLKRYLH